MQELGYIDLVRIVSAPPIGDLLDIDGIKQIIQISPELPQVRRALLIASPLLIKIIIY